MIEYDRFLAMLDERADAERPVGTAAEIRCNRHIGPPSNMTAPDNLPQWMIITNGNFITSTMTVI